MDNKVIVRLGHGYFNGGIEPLPNLCPTIDAHIDCWHVLIGEKMKNEEIKCNCVGMLGGKYEKNHDSARRVYDTNGVAPTQTTCGGGNLETKIIDDNRFFRQAFETAQESKQSGTSPTVTTRPEGFKTAILVVDEQNGYVRQDGIVGTLTTDGSSPKHNNRIIENLRIRKLTPKECGRLMGVRDKDIDTMAVNQSNSSQYHLYGDSIVVDVLMAIFGQML